jgi:hemerythrin superfamily protein
VKSFHRAAGIPRCGFVKPRCGRPAGGYHVPVAREPAVGRRKEESVNALKLLEKDHAAVKKMLKELEDTTERAVKTRQELLGKLKHELTVHEQMEESVIYPALKEHAKARDIVLEAYEEHDVVDVILGDLAQTPVDDETWHAKFKVMQENLLHHIEEEEGEMFDQARRVFDEATLESLGGQMEQVKAQAKAA